MPKIFEYMGIVFFFYSNEHMPIHVHARAGEYESKAEFFLVNGIIESVRITNIPGRDPLKGRDLKNFKIFIEEYAEFMVQKWVDFFVYKKSISFEKINRRIR